MLIRMNYLGIDYGERRIGLAYADEVGVAVPIPAAVENDAETRFKHIGEDIKKRRINVLVVGYPYNMDGSVGFKAREVDVFIDELSKRFALPIYRVDERLTSHQASSDMASMEGPRGRKKKSMKARQAARHSGELDSRAATLILREYIDSQTLREQPNIQS